MLRRASFETGPFGVHPPFGLLSPAWGRWSPNLEELVESLLAHAVVATEKEVAHGLDVIVYIETLALDVFWNQPNGHREERPLCRRHLLVRRIQQRFKQQKRF